MAQDYVRYDEIEDVLTSTDLLALIAPKLKRNPTFWKWAIIGSQNALQGAVVCALHDTIGVRVLTEKSAKAVLSWHDKRREGEYPEERLADFWTLFQRLCRAKPDLVGLAITRRQIRDVKRLHSYFRNNFSHFTPKTWSIEKAGLPRIVGTAINFIEVAMNQDQVTFRMTGNRKRRLAENLRKIRGGLVASLPQLD
jgi:hypothetical protein